MFGGETMDELEIGVITHYFSKIGVAVVKVEQVLKVGDMLRIKGMHADFVQKVDSMQVEHKNVTEAKPGDEVGMKVAQEVHEHDKVYKA
jgi:translation elongation factor EF-1alpha